MIKVVIAGKNRLFIQSLKAFLESEHVAMILSEADTMEKIFERLPELNPDILLVDIDYETSVFEMLRKITSSFSGIKCIVFSFSVNSEDSYQYVNAGIKGCVLKTSELNELADAIRDVAAGKIYFPRELLQEAIAQHRVGVSKDEDAFTSSELQVIQLLCAGLSNEEISEKLYLSYDTIKWHRSNILLKCGCKNILSLYKFALKNKLVKSV